MSLESPSLLLSAGPSIATVSSTTLSLSPMSSSGAPRMGDIPIPSSITPHTPFDSSRPRSPIQDSTSEIDKSLDVDPQIIEALKSKDRLYVLKLGELMESLINERKTRIDLTPGTSYQRLLVHRCSTYHKLAPETDSITKTITVIATSESRIPARRISELVPAEATALPAFKIMRRSPNDRVRSKPHSQAGSVAGEDADLSDVEPSEAGSLGGRSNATGSSKKRMTIEEREAAYNEARSRIFMDFEEKEKEKEKDMSASSSTLSLVSGSASTSGGGSVGDLDDSVSSPTTESEWSGSATRDRDKDFRRGGSGNGSATSSQRSLRSSIPPFNTNGSNSSRDSRSSSPAFQYASLYEPPSSATYDPSQMNQAPNPGYMPQFMYPYPLPNQMPPQGYLPPYPYYPPYPYQPSPQGVHPNSDPTTPANGGDPYAHHRMPPSQHVPYPNVYAWPHAPPPQTMQHPPVPPHHPPGHSNSPTPQSAPPQYSSYVHPPYSPYPVTGYFPYPPPQQGQPMSMPPPHMSGQPFLPNEIPRSMNGNRGGNPGGHNFNGSRNASSPGINNGNKRGAPPARSAWSFGPGVGMNGYAGTGSNGISGGEAVGPRLSMSRSGMSNGSGSSNGNRTPGDEASSTASSSTTSSSSRRTYTSTSSQHPLPARPDWAVGLKPQPTLHSTHSRHHENGLNNTRTISPRNGNQMQPLPSQQPPALLQSTDFPPLTTLSSPEKRTPVVGGAWANTRSVLIPNSNGNTRLEEPDKGFERPPPKTSSELFNPKGPNTRNNGKSIMTTDRPHWDRGEAVANAILADRVSSMSLEEPTLAT